MIESGPDTKESWVDPDDAPELDDHFFDNAELRRGARLIRPATDTMARRGRPPLDATIRRRAVSLRLSPHVLEHFRRTGAGWQSRIGEVLEEHVKATEAADR